MSILMFLNRFIWIFLLHFAKRGIPKVFTSLREPEKLNVSLQHSLSLFWVWSTYTKKHECYQCHIRHMSLFAYVDISFWCTIIVHSGFTGVNDPYEAPLNCEVSIYTSIFDQFNIFSIIRDLSVVSLSILSISQSSIHVNSCLVLFL